MKSPYKKFKIKGITRPAHRVIMEKKLGRPLLPTEVVHHIDEDKFNNDPSNLEVMSHQEHSAHHNQKYPLTKVCEACGATYTPALTKRKRAKSCSWGCRNELIARSKRGKPAKRLLSAE